MKVTDLTSTLSENPGTHVSPELKTLHEEIEAIKRQTTELVSGLTDEQLAWRPAPDRWSIADNLAHLLVVNDGYYLPQMRRAVADARGREATGSARHGMLGNLFVRMTEPPVRFRVPAPRQFVPPAEHAPQETIERFMRNQDEILRLAAEAEGVDLARTKVVSPINKHLKFTLGQAFRLLTAHERRHLWQARRVKDEAGFPR